MEFSIFGNADINVWVNALGYFGIALIIFAETGLFFCFFLPGDSLLFAAGFLASRNVLNIYWLLPLLVMAAFAGYWAGYLIGVYLEHRLERKADTWYFKKSYLVRSHAFYQKYGKITLLIGRFVPVARSFIPLIAGIATMPSWTYTLFNFLGAILWVGLMTLLGYYLGAIIPDSGVYFWLIIFAIIIVLIAPTIIKKYRKGV
ncbi:MAG: hypothetical protein A3E82_08490 [Gammaproteobacteria bacterium RIFCSPHIGHO2_12_FULL_38_11]|nr:MAG: hypothetical protein A3E82_08490 [Gammaproteobacteria bacterium RIFCSPHIGHO2_12_FULL_38_11]